MFIFWCKLANGNHNSISTNNLLEAPRRARELGAVSLFGMKVATRAVFQMAI